MIIIRWPFLGRVGIDPGRFWKSSTASRKRNRNSKNYQTGSPGKFDVSHASQNPATVNAFRNRHLRSTLLRWQCLPEWLLSPRGELPLRQAHHENSARASQYQLANAIGSDFPVARQFCHSAVCFDLQTTPVSDLYAELNFRYPSHRISASIETLAT